MASGPQVDPESFLETVDGGHLAPGGALDDVDDCMGVHVGVSDDRALRPAGAGILESSCDLHYELGFVRRVIFEGAFGPCAVFCQILDGAGVEPASKRTLTAPRSPGVL